MLSATFGLWILAICTLVASEAYEDPIQLSPHVDLKRISKKDGDIAVSSSITREQHILPGNLLDLSDGHDYDSPTKSPQSNPPLRSGSPFPSRGTKFGKDTPQKDSRQKPSSPTGKPRGGYGYPFLIAPTLSPIPRSNSDAAEKEPKSKSIRIAIPRLPAMPEMPKFPEGAHKLSKSGGAFLKKRKDSSFDESEETTKYAVPVSRRYGIYKEPSYRNLFDLEVAPNSRSYDGRRIDYEPYSPPTSYYSSPASSRPPTSPRDPYLSPSDEPVDGFYPKVYKSNGESTSHSAYGKKDGYYGGSYDAPSSAGRGYDDDSGEDFGPPPSSHHDDLRLGHGGYVKSHKYSGDSGSYSGLPPHGPSSSGGYDPGYSSLQNSPIVGETRKRLLDYTGATDIYEGEPDYLKDAAFRKSKFGSIQDDYYPYGRSHSFGFTDYHFDENRPRPSRIRRSSTTEEGDVPDCAKNSTVPSMCLTDAHYPETEIKNAVAKNVQYILQLGGATIEATEKKKKKSPTSLKELTRSRDLCSSSKGDVYPLRARDVTGVWRIIVNINGAQQSVFVDACGAAGSTCDFLPPAIASRCNQKHSALSLLTFDPRDHRLGLQDFPVPTSCSCSVARPLRTRPE